MDPSPVAVLKLIGPMVPSLGYSAVTHSLGFTHTSSVWDLRTAITVQVLRNIMTADNGRRKRQPIGLVQQRAMADPGTKGKIWLATETVKKPQPGEVDEVVYNAIEQMSSKEQALPQYTRPGCVDTEIEWTGYRPGVKDSEPLYKGSEEEKYKKLMADVKSSVTILYFHGGAYYLCDPSTHRGPCKKLAEHSGGRVASVRYRLAPQTAFPGQLIDALMVYLSLLSPPEGSMHEAIPAEKIVIGGDSAGGNLAFALLQLLLHMHRSNQSGGNPTTKFHGKDVAVPLPAGVSANSGWFDITRSMPSMETNIEYDYLPGANHDDSVSSFPHDDIWPTKPPRGDLFCDLELLDHPLVSMHLAENWKDSPPLWFSTGQEMLTDEDRLVASRAVSQGVTIQFEEYQAMPHCFQMLIPHLATAERCFKSWGEWARRCVENPLELKTNGVYVYAKTGKEKEINVATMEPVAFGEAVKRAREAKERRLKGFDKEGKNMPKPAL